MKKRVCILVLAVLLILGLCACAKKQQSVENTPSSYTVERAGGTTYTVTPVSGTKGTISDGTYTYSYSYRTTSDGYSVTFTYPDGETYTWTQNGDLGSGAASLNFDFEKYPSGMTLKGLLRQAGMTEQKPRKNLLLPLLLLVIGALNAVYPKVSWYLDTGWKIKDAEPSDTFLAWNRGIGIVVIIVAVILILV